MQGNLGRSLPDLAGILHREDTQMDPSHKVCFGTMLPTVVRAITHMRTCVQ
jgi:hypothetical protein